jgi:hypothetical protein
MVVDIVCVMLSGVCKSRIFWFLYFLFYYYCLAYLNLPFALLVGDLFCCAPAFLFNKKNTIPRTHLVRQNTHHLVRIQEELTTHAEFTRASTKYLTITRIKNDVDQN